MINTDVLDNPIWHALQTTQQHFASGNEWVQMYSDDVLPFAAMKVYDPDLLVRSAGAFLPGQEIFIYDGFAALPADWTLLSRVPCWQMVFDGDLPDVAIDSSIEQIGKDSNHQLYDLVNLVQPGFFRTNTQQLGDYFGIRENDQLIAVAGERLRITGFTEISAVCTHPDYTGRGLARRLLMHICNKIIVENRHPFLHVVETNTRAIRLYESIGFVKRRDFPLLSLRFGVV